MNSETLDKPIVKMVEIVEVLSSGAPKMISEVVVTPIDRHIWALNALENAISCVERTQRTLIRSSELFRENKFSEAHGFFFRCLEGLERFLETLMRIRVTLKLDFQQITHDGISLTQHEHNLLLILKNILHLQGQGDYENIAEKLEYELLTNLVGWGHALKQILFSQDHNC